MFSVAPASYSPLSLRRLFLPPFTCRSDGCLSLGSRRSGRRLPVARPPLSVALLSIRPSSSGRKQQFFELEDEDEVEEDEEEDEDVAAEEYVNGVLATGAFSEDVDEYAESEEEEVEVEVGVEVQHSAGSLTQYNHHKWQRVERLITEVREFGEEIIDFDELAGVYDFPIDKFQRLAIQAFLRGSSVVVSAPTSSGKTLIAEASAMATVAKGRRLFYTTPLKALSNQKYRDFRKSFGENRVGLLTGDSSINKDASILIMTTEILRNMMYQSVGMVSSGSKLFDVDVVVLDEVHYLSDISRGTVWEEIVIYCPKEVQLICLSATVANPDELAGWIGQIHGKTELVVSTKRPVPLQWYFSLKNSLLPLLDEKGTKINSSFMIYGGDYDLGLDQTQDFRRLAIPSSTNLAGLVSILKDSHLC